MEEGKDYKLIELNKTLQREVKVYTKVSPEDYEELNKYSWSELKADAKIYAYQFVASTTLVEQNTAPSSTQPCAIIFDFVAALTT